MFVSLKIPDKLIADASILFSFFKSDSARRQVFKKLLNKGCEVISPEYVLEELLNNKPSIIHFAKIGQFEFSKSFSELKIDLDTFEEKSYSEFFSEANKLSPHGKDTKDDPYFALSLALNKTSIWSDEPGFKEQSEIEILTTDDLMKLLGLK